MGLYMLSLKVCVCVCVSLGENIWSPMLCWVQRSACVSLIELSETMINEHFVSVRPAFHTSVYRLRTLDAPSQVAPGPEITAWSEVSSPSAADQMAAVSNQTGMPFRWLKEGKK